MARPFSPFSNSGAGYPVGTGYPAGPGSGAMTPWGRRPAFAKRRPQWPPWWMGPNERAISPVAADARGESDEARLRRLEAVLFLAREPLNSRKLSQYANLADGTEARTLIRRLNAWYDAVGRAFRVEEMAGGFRLMTRPKFGAWLKRLTHTPSEVRLSAPALETLAVVAYRQPVLKAAIEAIRGVQCGEVLRQLMERDLVRIVGRSDELGRPYLYGPTKRFLEVFGLRSLDDLPRAETLRVAPGTDPETVPAPANEPATNSHSIHPQQEKVTVRIQEFSEEQAHRRWTSPASATAPVPVLAADDEDFEEDVTDDEEEGFDDDLDGEEDLEEEDLDEEEWEYDEEEEDDNEEEDLDDLDEEEWSEVEEDDDDLEDDDEEDDDWGDDDEDEDWGEEDD